MVLLRISDFRPNAYLPFLLNFIGMKIIDLMENLENTRTRSCNGKGTGKGNGNCKATTITVFEVVV